MIQYIDKKKRAYASFSQFKREHPGIVCPAVPDDDILELLGLKTIEVETPNENIEAVREMTLEDLNRRFLWFREHEAKVKSSLGFVADATERALIDVSALVAITEASEKPISFMDAENKLHELTHDQLVKLRKEIALKSSETYSQKWKHRERILLAKSIVDIDEALSEANFN